MSRVWLRRSWAHGGLLAAMALTVLVSVLLCILTVGLAERSQQPAVRQTVLDSPVRSVGVEAQAAASSDAEAQTKAAERVIRRTFAGVPISVTRSVATSPVALEETDARRAGVRSIVLMQDDAVLRSAIRVSSGSWPAAAAPNAPYPAALQADAARRLHLAIGDSITIPSGGQALHLRLAATWRPVSAGADIWFGDQRVASGVAAGALGPLIVGAKALESLDATPSVSWVVTPVGSALQPDQLVALERGFASLDNALSADSAVATGSVTVSGDGLRTAQQMSSALSALGIVVSVPLTLLAVGAVLALLLLARLLAETRQSELTLLRARGGNGATLLTATVGESIIVGLAGALIGAIAAIAVVAASTGGPPTIAAVLVPAVAAVLALVAVQAGVTVVSIRSALSSRPDSGRARSFGSLGATVLVVAAAAFALWRFLAYGGSANGVDPAATAAPVLVLLAAVLLGLAAIGPLARVLDAAGVRASGVLAAVTARQLARSIRFVAAPLALVVLAVGGTVLASSYIGSWSSYRASAARIENGGDLRVAVGATGPISGADALGPTRSARGVRAASIALRTSAALGSDTVPVLAAHVPALGAVLSSDADALHLQTLRAALPAPDLRGSIPLPAHASSMTLRYTAGTSSSDAGATVRPTAWLADSLGDLVPVVFPSHRLDAGSSAAEATASVPAALAPWRILAIDIALNSSTAGASYAFEVTGASAGAGAGQPLPITAARGWRVADTAFGTPSSVRANSSGIGMHAPLLDATFGETVRLVPGAAGSASTPSVAVTAALAQADGLSVGNRIALDGVWWTTNARVAAIVPVLPGENSSRAMFFDVGSLRTALLQNVAAPPSTNELWLATNSSDAPAVALQAVTAAAPPGSRVTTADATFTDRFFSAAIVGLWLGSLGGVAFSVIALAAAAAALTRRRRSEVGVLRALGFSLRQQLRIRSVELGAVSATGVLIGIVAGILVAIAVTAALVRLTVITAPPALSVPLLADPRLLGVGIGLLIVSVVAVVAGFRIRIRRQAADTAHREETR